MVGLKAILRNESGEEDGYVRFYAAFAMQERATHTAAVAAAAGGTVVEEVAGARWRRSLAAAEMARKTALQQ